MHQPGARPPGGRIEARLVSLGADLAIAAERGIDQPLVERRQIVVGDLQPAAHRRRILVMNTSASATSRRSTDFPAAERRSSARLFLLRPSSTKPGLLLSPGPISGAARLR